MTGPRLKLDGVTLCAATSVNVAATVAAMEHSLAGIDFADAILFTDADLPAGSGAIRTVKIDRIGDAAAYSRFMVRDLPRHIVTSHCLVVQWDGFVIDAGAWDPGFLDLDYIGAVWPQFETDKVGNGGFSLRSRKLLAALADPDFIGTHPEDLVICRDNRRLLIERHGIVFADEAQAARFSYERQRDADRCFGFHGVFNLPDAAGAEAFWSIYRSLDHRTPVFHDVWSLARRLFCASGSRRPAVLLLLDYLAEKCSR